MVDASVAAKWFFDEELSTPSRKLLRGDVQLHAPEFFLLEMESVFCKRVHRRNITADDARQGRKILRRIPIAYWETRTIGDLAFEMAVTTQQSIYDCLYVALAQLLGASLVTADRRLWQTFSTFALGQHVLWVEQA